VETNTDCLFQRHGFGINSVLVHQPTYVLCYGGYSASSYFSLGCSFRSKEESNSGQDPVLSISVFALHTDIEHGDKVSSTSVSGEVKRALVTTFLGSKLLADGRDVNSGNFRGEFLEHHLVEVSLFAVTACFPASSLKS